MNTSQVKHLFKLSQVATDEKTAGGLRLKANRANFPILSGQGMSLYKLVLAPKGLREPHWHANADELGYCLKGTVLVTLYDTGDSAATFVVKAGECFLIPSGSLHYIQNISAEQAEIILSFSSDDTEDFNISTVLGMFSNHVLANTWGQAAKTFELFNKPQQVTFAALNPVSVDVPTEAFYKSPYRYSLEEAEPLLANAGGSARMARQDSWPIASRQALYALRLSGQGMREPHWHPETAELGYVEQGLGRMSIMSGDGSIDTYTMEAGDIYFIPKAYPHHIENLNDKQDLHLLIFFNQGMPKDIGFTGSLRSFPSAALAAATHNEAAFFESLPKYYKDAFIVTKQL